MAAQASPYTIQLSPDDTPGYTHAQGLTAESAELVSDLLNINHESYHTRWKQTFHNHNVHHLLALWALGATPAQIQDMWEYNKPYQSPIKAAEDKLPRPDLKDPKVFDSLLGNNDHYVDFLRFFEYEIANKGVPCVVKEYLLKGDERADDLFGRMFTDLVHPMIHLGCGIEFKQPAIVAEALAGAAVHEAWPKGFLLAAEAYERAHPEDATQPPGTYLEMLDGMRRDPVIATGVRATDPFNKIPDGLLRRVSPQQLAPHLARFRVAATPAALRARCAEMMQACAYVAGAAQRPGKREALDFVLIHAATLAVFFPALLAQDWLSDGDKARLLAAKARVDAVLYAGCACPPLHTARVAGYRPRHPEHGWPELVRRAVVYRDEGHAVKLVRMLFAVEALGAPAPGVGLPPIGRDGFRKIAHMAMDSIEGAFGPDGHRMAEEKREGILAQVGVGGEMVVGNMTRWVFYGGLDGAWDSIPDLDAPVIPKEA